MSNRVQPPDHARTCLAALFRGPGEPLEVQEFPVPKPGPGEAVIRVDCCTICGSDLHTVTGARTEPVPSILGHEILGTVSEVGEEPLCDIDSVPLAPGDRVTWSTCISCSECDRCQAGMPQKCRKLAKYGHEVAGGRQALSGGLAERILLRGGSAVIKVDPQIPAHVICPVNCATATIAAAFRAAGPIAGDRVLILGAGMLGLTAAAFAKANKAARVTVCDLNADRLRLAKRFGADAVAEWHADEDEFSQRLSRVCDTTLHDLVLELSGAPDAVEAACRLGDVGGRVILVGTVMESRPVQLDPQQIVRRLLSIRGVHNYAPDDLRTAVKFLKRFHGDFPFDELVEATYPLADVNNAIEMAIENHPVRVAIRP